MNPCTTITWEHFEEKFKPMKNCLDSNASYDGCMYETYGKEDEYVSSMALKEPRRVWTVVENDEGELCLVDGWHLVNRIGYIITEEPCPESHYIVND